MRWQAKRPGNRGRILASPRRDNRANRGKVSSRVTGGNRPSLASLEARKAGSNRDKHADSPDSRDPRGKAVIARVNHLRAGSARWVQPQAEVGMQ